jgi:hypothetical protein
MTIMQLYSNRWHYPVYSKCMSLISVYLWWRLILIDYEYYVANNYQGCELNVRVIECLFIFSIRNYTLLVNNLNTVSKLCKILTKFSERIFKYLLTLKLVTMILHILRYSILKHFKTILVSTYSLRVTNFPTNTDLIKTGISNVAFHLLFSHVKIQTKIRESFNETDI